MSMSARKSEMRQLRCAEAEEDASSRASRQLHQTAAAVPARQPPQTVASRVFVARMICCSGPVEEQQLPPFRFRYFQIVSIWWNEGLTVRQNVRGIDLLQTQSF